MLPQVFDPLVDLAGCWTATPADTHLPVRQLAGARHECVDSRLVIGRAAGVTPANTVDIEVARSRRVVSWDESMTSPTGTWPTGPR